MALLERCWITVKSVYFRITLTRFTIAFFLFCFIHCFAEGFIQAFIFSQDFNANSVVVSILRQAKVPRNNFGIMYHGHNASLKLCNMLSPNLNVQHCATVFQTGNPNLTLPTMYNLTSSEEGGVFNSLIKLVNSTNGIVEFELDDGSTVEMNQMCTLVLTYPHQVLANAQREDVVLVLTQFWIFCVSFFAIMYDSIPHLIAALCFRTLATGWSMYIIWRNGDVESRFKLLLSSDSSPCKRLDIDKLFPGYFMSRQAMQIPDLTLNIVALALAVYLSIKLIKVYGPNTFNRVGAPPHIVRIYKYFLGGFVSFQVSALFLISVVSLWLDQMVNRDNAMSGFTKHKNLYIALNIITLVILIPWITTGWYAIHRERKRLMVAFLVVASLVFASWVLMLKSWSFSWTFVNWPFFAVQIIIATLSLISTIGFCTVSYLHFGKGLAHYLYVEDVLAKSGFEPTLFEKDVEKAPVEDWREIGLDDSIPTYTLSFSASAPVEKDLN